VPTPNKIAFLKPALTNLAQTSHYQVTFGGLPTPLKQYLGKRGVGSFFIGETVGLLCNSASLPGSSLGTADVVGNFMGVAEKMAHTRLFNQIELEFYVDYEYKAIKFLEHWTEFIAIGSNESQASDGYYFRMRYPDEYKTSQTKIVKFDRNYVYELEYNFFGMFPIAVNSIPVNYGNSEILKVSASFFFDRYVSGKITSASVFGGNDNNKESNSQAPGSSVGIPVKGFSGVVFKNQTDALNPNAQTYYDIQLTNPTPFPEGG